MLFEDNVALNPVHFFAFQVDCYESASPMKALLPAKYMLESLSDVSGEEVFATVFATWNAEGLGFVVEVEDAPIKQCRYPDVSRGDSIELFIDTRDVKNSGYNTRYCHHFFFLPEAVEGIDRGEITRFRAEDKHEHCEASRLQLTINRYKTGYQAIIFIPEDCLHGYDVKEFTRLGFSYRINRSTGTPQHFGVKSEEYQIEQQPSLWSTLRLKV